MPGLGFRFRPKPAYSVRQVGFFFMAQRVSLGGPNYGLSQLGHFPPDPIDDP